MIALTLYIEDTSSERYGPGHDCRARRLFCYQVMD